MRPPSAVSAEHRNGGHEAYVLMRVSFSLPPFFVRIATAECGECREQGRCSRSIGDNPWFSLSFLCSEMRPLSAASAEQSRVGTALTAQRPRLRRGPARRRRADTALMAHRTWLRQTRLPRGTTRRRRMDTALTAHRIRLRRGTARRAPDRRATTAVGAAAAGITSTEVRRAGGAVVTAHHRHHRRAPWMNSM